MKSIIELSEIELNEAIRMYLNTVHEIHISKSATSKVSFFWYTYAKVESY